MIKIIRTIAILGLTASLGACMSHNPNGYMNFQSYTWDGQPLYPESYDGSYTYGDHQRVKKQVVVPETYHVGAYHSPARAKDRDRSWVHQQNPGNYTIELGSGEKASAVARKLYKAPKSNRSAQVKVNQNGKTYYKGLYGSYPSYDAAQKALKDLPDDVKQGANIKPFGNVQRSVGQ
jgi:hypothetical protein